MPHDPVVFEKMGRVELEIWTRTQRTPAEVRQMVDRALALGATEATAKMPADRTITINGRDYVSDEAAAANTREAVEPLLAEIERLRSRLDQAHMRQMELEEAFARFDSDACTAAEADEVRSVFGGSRLRIKISRDALASLPSGPVTAADVQRARERVSPRFGETILPAMTIPDDGRVDAGMKERDWFETPMSLISSPPVADGIPEWSGADGGRDGA